MYLVPAEREEQGDLFVEWVYVNNSWEKFGSTAINITTPDWEADEGEDGYILNKPSIYKGLNNGIQSVKSSVAKTSVGNFAVSLGGPNGFITAISGDANVVTYNYTPGSINDKRAELIQQGCAKIALASDFSRVLKITGIDVTQNTITVESTLSETAVDNKQVYISIHNYVSGNSAAAFGTSNVASGSQSFSSGFQNIASGSYSSASGLSTLASGIGAKTSGMYTVANHSFQNVFGTYNASDSSTAAATARGNYVEIVGNGTNISNRSNARTLDWSGNEWLAGNLKVGGTGYDDTNAKTVATLDKLGYVTPEMFGAVGEGVTDDTTAISQAFSSGLNVQFKNGATYNISGALTITNPIVIYGNGATIKQTSARTNAIVASGVSNITISDLCIIGYGDDYVGKGGQIAPYGIYIHGASENQVSNIVVQNCVVKYCTWCGIDISYADDVIIVGNTVVGTGTQDLEYESNYQFGITFGYGTNIKVLSNTVSETAQGLYIGQKLKNAIVSNNVIKDIRGQHGCYATSGTNFEFSNNVLSNIAMEGIKMQLDAHTEENAKNGIIAFNVFSGIGSFAIHTVNLTDNGYVVENYAINDNVIDNSANGVYITSGKDIVVKNNTIVNSNYGIRFRYMSAGNLILENNFIKNIQNNGIAQYSDDVTTVKDLIIKNNVLKECGQAGTASANAMTIRLNHLTVTGKFVVDGNYISDDNNLSYQAGSINGQFSEGLVFVNNHIRNKSIYIGADLREFNNNVCEDSLTIVASKYAGRKTRAYTGTVSDLPANTSGYSNGDMFYFTDVATSGYAMAVLQDGAWAMLGKLDDYVIHPFIDTHSASRCTINSVSITSSGDELTVSMSITVLTRGSETVIGNFKTKSSLLPSAKTTIYANNISVYLTTSGYLTISGGVANTTYDFTVKLVNGVLQSS